MSQLITNNPIAVFLYGVKSPESKRQYPRRFKMFLDFLHLPGDLQDQAKEFLRNAKNKSQWVQANSCNNSSMNLALEKILTRTDHIVSELAAIKTCYKLAQAGHHQVKREHDIITA